MKRYLKRGLAVLMIAVILVSVFSVFSFASVSRPQANTGTRDEICTTFSGTTAPTYYTGSYSYDTLSQLSSSSLLSQLRRLMTDTHDGTSSYDNCRDYVYYTDCENGDTSKFTTIYTSYSATKNEYNSGNGWNREHVWPQNLGGFSTSGAGADLHHIRPSENKTNGDRSNLKYGEVSGGTQSKGNLSGIVGGAKNGTYYEPLDNVKGDVARICLYIYVRYGSEYTKCASITNVFQSVDVLLEWCKLDPVDTWEIERNDVIEGVQGNRNVFIDYPEFAWLIFGRAVPSDMTTPSGEAAGGTGSGSTGSGNTGTGSGNQTVCTHTSTKTVGAKAATCENGYTGDTYCASCNTLLTNGTDIPAVHDFDEWVVIIPAKFGEDGMKTRICALCSHSEVEAIPALTETNSPSNDNSINPALIVVFIAAPIAVGAGVAVPMIVHKKRKK